MFIMKKLHLILAALFLISSGARAQESCGTLTDYDGNVYATVQVGKQCWMAQNLRTTHYADGRALTLGTETSATGRFYYHPDNKADNIPTYGLLYSWYTVMDGHATSEDVPSGVQGLCPAGWHLPSNFEWMAVEDFLGYKEGFRCGTDVNNVARCMASKTGWHSDFMTQGQPCCIVENLSANNASGMNVLPAGNFFHTVDGFGVDAGFWTASEGSDVSAPIHHFYYTNAMVEINCTPKEAAYSVRCVKN